MGDENADPFYGAPAIALVLADGNKSTWVEDGTNVLCYLMLAQKHVMFPVYGYTGKRNF